MSGPPSVRRRKHDCAITPICSTGVISTACVNLLAEDVRLDLVNRTKLAGRKDVSVYFTRYAAAPPCRVSPGFADGRPALLVSGADDDTIRYAVLLGWSDERVATIRDFLYAPYAMEGVTTQRF